MNAHAAGWPSMLYLYVAGARAEQAEANGRHCCDAHSPGQYTLEVIAVRHQLELARREQLVALPALMRHYPAPCQHLTGTLTNEAQLVSCLVPAAAC